MRRDDSMVSGIYIFILSTVSNSEHGHFIYPIDQRNKYNSTMIKQDIYVRSWYRNKWWWLHYHNGNDNNLDNCDNNVVIDICRKVVKEAKIIVIESLVLTCYEMGEFVFDQLDRS